MSVFSLDQPEGWAVAGFCRPYAQSVQGRLKQVRFDRETGILDLHYQASADIDQPTQVHLPTAQYPHGVHIACLGPVLCLRLKQTRL